MSLRTAWFRIPSGSGFLSGVLTVALLTPGSGSTPATSDASIGFPDNELPTAVSLLPRTPVSGPPQDSLFALATFDSVWSRIRSTYWDEDLGGLDWDGVRSELRPRAASASSARELRSIITQMLSRLDQSHFVLMPSDIEPAFTSSRRTGSASPGLEVRWIDDELLITRVLDGEPAMDSDIGPGWILREIDGLPVDSLAAAIFETPHVDRPVDDGGLRLHAAIQSRLLGPPDSRVRLVVADASGAIRTLNLRRVEPPGELVEFGNLPPVRMEVEHRREVTGSGTEVGVIRLTAWFPSAAPLLGRAIDELREVDGIILDLRGNPGGVGGL
ncbi:MAG: S41 family peptidase, partial [Gemmatimonadota bacterium]